MALYIKTSNPQQLLDSIIESIKNQTVQTWSIDVDGDFTHVSQWKNKAWMKSYVDSKFLAFGIIGRKDEVMTKTVYGIFHGRFSEMLLTHFDRDIKSIEITPNKINGLDSFK